MIHKDQLLSELKVLLFDYNKKKDITDYMIEELSERNMEEWYKLMQGGIDLDIVDETILGVFVYLLHEKTQDEEINPESYWFPPEMREIKMYRGSAVKPHEEGIEFENVIRIDDNVYVTSISVQQIYELHNRKLIIYNKDAQRSTKVYQYGNRIVEKIDLDLGEVREIRDKMISGTYKPDTLSFNVSRDDFDSELYYDEETHRLKIHGYIEVNDGFHRYTAMLEAYKINPESDFKVILKITNYSLSDARDAIAQFDKQRKLKIEHAKTLEASNLGMVIAQEMNSYSKSEFKGKIVKDKILISKGIGVTFFSTIATAANVMFEKELKTQAQAKRVSRFLIETSNFIYSYYYNEFNNKNGDSLVKSPNAFMVYVGLGALIYEDGKWNEDKEAELEMMLDELNFSKGGELDNVTKLGAANPSNRLAIKIDKYLKEKFN